MKMTFKLTKRDVFLIYVIIFVLVGFIFIRYFMTPMLDEISALDLEIDNAEVEQFDMQSKIAMLPASRKTNEDLKKQLTEQMIEFYPLMESYDIDKLFSSFLLERGVLVTEFSVSAIPVKAAIVPYMATEPTETTGSSLYTSYISINIEGDYETLLDLTSTLIDDYPSLCVTSYTIGREIRSVDGSGNAPEEEYTTLSLGLDFYMTGTPEEYEALK